MIQTRCNRCSRDLAFAEGVGRQTLTWQTPDGVGQQWHFCDRCWRRVFRFIRAAVDTPPRAEAP